MSESIDTDKAILLDRINDFIWDFGYEKEFYDIPQFYRNKLIEFRDAIAQLDDGIPLKDIKQYIQYDD
jgi:hypothetical protein